MGNSLETAIVISVVLVVLALLITGPEDVCLSALEDCRYGMEEIDYELGNEEVFRSTTSHGTVVSDVCAERLCTFLKGLSDNYRLIYNGITDLTSGGD